MEEEKNITEKEKLLFICSSIILAGIASNYSTVCPSETHALIAKSAAKTLLNSILK